VDGRLDRAVGQVKLQDPGGLPVVLGIIGCRTRMERSVSLYGEAAIATIVWPAAAL
jgi:hypothetical protein